MVNFLKEHWFGFVLSLFVFIFLLFSVIITIAPHNDAEMRGFTPCTYQMADEFNKIEDVKFTDVLTTVGIGYGCYFGVIYEGMRNFIGGKQKTPWANYLFVVKSIESEDENIEDEPFSEDLIKAKMFDDETSDDAETEESSND